MLIVGVTFPRLVGLFGVRPISLLARIVQGRLSGIFVVGFFGAHGLSTRSRRDRSEGDNLKTGFLTFGATLYCPAA
jgi:hypothetical protein